MRRLQIIILFIGFSIVTGVLAVSFFKRKEPIDPSKAYSYYKKANTGFRPWLKKKKHQVSKWFKKKKNISDAKQIEKEWARVEKM